MARVEWQITLVSEHETHFASCVFTLTEISIFAYTYKFYLFYYSLRLLFVQKKKCYIRECSEIVSLGLEVGWFQGEGGGQGTQIGLKPKDWRLSKFGEKYYAFILEGTNNDYIKR